MPNFTISASEKNRWFMTDKYEIICFDHVKIENNQFIVYGNKILEQDDFFRQPIASSNFQIYKSCGKLGPLHSWHYKLIHKKLFSMPLKNGIVFFPLLHTA